MESRKKYAELHLHSQDQFDSDNRPSLVCQRLKELGAAGFALTQHGVLSGIEPMKTAAEEYGLKFIPGIEIYYGNTDDLMKNQHLILLSIDYEGYRAIWKAVSEPSVQNSTGRAVVNYETLQKYFGPGAEGHGKVIATSACINGVIATSLRFNEASQREIDRLTKRAEKLENASLRVEQALQKVEELDALIQAKTTERDTLKPIAEAKFGQRERLLKKINDPEQYEAEFAKLEADKKASEEAQAELTEVKNKLTALKRQKTAFAGEARKLQVNAEKETQIMSEIQVLEEGMMSDEDLFWSAVEETKKFVKIFGEGNFYMEIQNHGIDKEKEIYPVLVDVARELDVPIVASNDVHTVTNSKEELLRRQILRSMRFDNWEEQAVGDDQLYIKTDEEMVEWLSKIFDKDVVDEAMSNIKVIFDRCHVEFPQETHYPMFPSKDGKTSKDIFIEEIKKGIEWRFPEGISQEYKDRLNQEYKIIHDMGYIDYHLIVKDFLEYGRALAPVPDKYIAEAPLEIDELNQWVKEHGWEGGFTIGPGRGSAAGSLICYCLGITNIDPFKYDLLFERFLNPERVSMPDIDSDIANRIRPKVIDYIKHKYGEDAVCGIMTTNAQAPRGAIRIAAKYYGESLSKPKEFLQLGDKMAKMVPNEPGIAFDTVIAKSGRGEITVYDKLKTEFADNQAALTILDWAKAVEGCFTAYGAHAAGIVVSDGKPVSDYVPLRWNNKLNEMTTQVDMIKVEEQGLLKIDCLGLKTLDIITDCIRNIAYTKGVVIDPLKIPMDDKEVYDEIFKKARTNSVFQFESEGMKSMLQRFKPDTFEDLIILVSMFRPGPLQFLDDVINVKNGFSPMTFLCPELEPILGKTYGSIVYQEQVMEIFQKLAGYTLGQSDNVRRYMSKKKMDKLVHEKESFIHGDASRNIIGCVANGISESVAEALFQQMTDFAKYAFNKSHAAAYASNSYYTAWLKYHYPAEFLAAALDWAETDKIEGLVKDAQSFGIKVLVPDINMSSDTFTLDADGNIRFGLSSIKNVGASSEEIIAEHKNGPFGSIQEFFERTNVKKNAAESLMLAGAFDSFSDNRQAMVSVIEPYKDVIAKIKAKSLVIDEIDSLLPVIDSLSKEELEARKSGLHFSLGTATTAEKLSKKRDTFVKTLMELKAQETNILLPDMKEDFGERLKIERELLGMYISAHPLNAYEVAAEYNAKSIQEAISFLQTSKQVKYFPNGSKSTIKPVTVLCVINDIAMKTDKRGSQFAVVQAEDKERELTMMVWDVKSDALNGLLEVGNAVLATGILTEKENWQDETLVEYSMNVNKLSSVAQKKSKFEIRFRTVADFQKMSPILEKRYLDEQGHRWVAYIAETDTFQEMNFRLAEKCADIPGVKEMKA